MRLHVLAVGRLRADRPERSLFEDYQLRFNQIARPLALGPLAEVEVEDRRNLGREAEADLLTRAVPAGAMIVALDERGRQCTSPEFAALLARWRDGGATDLAFVIGGADGLAPKLRDRAHHALSFGQMVWPHMLARVLLAEQIYRAATILSGSPYHRA
jgi:23S rRNA (pseudouridine1915-N3)-methyltransferase